MMGRYFLNSIIVVMIILFLVVTVSFSSSWFTMGNKNYVHTADGQLGDPGVGCVCRIQLGLGQMTTGTDEWRTT